MRMLALALAALAVGPIAGCSSPQDSAASVADAGGAESSHAPHGHPGHSGDGWWCDEHGVPEEVCALCDSKLAAEFQRKGDWCADHNRPDSQCFACHPELEARFAARFEAKYGKKPPKPEG